MSSFWFILKQQWTIEEISIFSNSSHLEWNRKAVRHNFERDPPKDHPCQVWFNLFQGFQRRRFKCESLRRTTTDAKWWQKLTWPLARWAKNGFPHWWCGISISLYHLTDLWKKYIKSTLYWTSASFNNCIIKEFWN